MDTFMIVQYSNGKDGGYCARLAHNGWFAVLRNSVYTYVYIHNMCTYVIMYT